MSHAEQVHRHLDQHEVRYLQFAFRWMNNLLMREVPLHCTIRLWDTYQVSCPHLALPPLAASCHRPLPAWRLLGHRWLFRSPFLVSLSRVDRTARKTLL